MLLINFISTSMDETGGRDDHRQNMARIEQELETLLASLSETGILDEKIDKSLK